LQVGTENSIEEIVRSKAPTFLTFQNKGIGLEVKKLIAMETLVFIKASYPTTDAELVSKEFAKEIFERKDWKVADIRMFFTFIKQSAEKEEFKVLGNSIGLMTLLKFVSYYEEQRSWAREQKMKEYKETENQPIAENMKEWIDKVLKTVSDNTPKIHYNTQPLKMFDPVQFEADFILFKSEIENLNNEQKKAFKNSIYNVNTIVPQEMERREKLLNLLK